VDSQRFQRLSEIFEVARVLPVMERDAYLRGACGDDAALLAEVRELLSHHEEPSGRLDEPLAMPASVVASISGSSIPAATIPLRIGRYRIIRKVGEGGMGVVYEAEQDNPRRIVALKVISASLATTKMLRRFEHEAQILGKLQHPGIAQIFEAGTFEPTPGAAPQPFFAMEFVRGVPVTQFARDHDLGTRERLELVARIADAVQHAHGKGVIHRDLKPGNILVEENSESTKHKAQSNPHPELSTQHSALPKILDFGVARATDGDLALTTLRTDVGQLVGTLPYMSPEQAAGNPDDLDTRSDVYALGVIAYELLSGRLPYDLTRKLAAEAARIIRDEEPTRLSAINRTFRGDIETIIAKALEKDKARRYQSAVELGEDIRRYLRDEPVIARPPSARYQLRKFARRHKGLAAGAAAVVLVLIAGIIGTSIAWAKSQASEGRAIASQTRAENEKANAERATERAISAEQIALDRLKLVELEAAKSDAVNTFLTDMLTSVDPRLTADRELTMREALDQAAQSVDEGKLKDQPEVEAVVRQAIGQTYLQLGEYEKGQSQLEKSVGEFQRIHPGDHPDTAEAMAALAEVLRESRQSEAALPVAREALAMKRRLSAGQDSAELATSISNVALCIKQGGAGPEGSMEECETLNREALAMFRRIHKDQPHDDLSMSLNNLAMTIWAVRRDLPEVEKLLREALDIQRQLRAVPHPFLANALQNMADLLKAKGDQQEAALVLREAVEVHVAVLGPDHERVGETMNNLAIIEKNLGHYDLAEPLYLRSIEIRRKFWGERHQTVAESLGNYGVYLSTVGRLDEARKAQEETVSIRSEGLGPEHGLTIIARANVAHTYWRQEQFEEAETIFEELLPLRRARPGQAGLDLSIHLVNHGNFLRERGRLDKAEVMLIEALELRKAASGEEHPDTATCMNNLANVWKDQGKRDEAEAMHRRCLEIRVARLGPEHPLTALSQANIASVLLDRGDADGAIPLLRSSLELRRAKLPADSSELPGIMGLLGAALTRQGDAASLAEAEPLLRQALEMRRPQFPAVHWRTGESAGALGDCLMKQAKFTEAQPLLLERADAVMKESTVLPLKRRHAIQTLIELYDATNQPQEAATWRERLAAVETTPP